MLFTPLLYQNVGQLTAIQSLRLIETLNLDICAQQRPHPGGFIRQLYLSHVATELVRDGASESALQSIYRFLPAAYEPQLRTLHFNVASGINALGSIVVNFPHLKELFVSCSALDVDNFTFMQKGGLDAFGLALEVDLENTMLECPESEQVLLKLSEAIEKLPLTSPRLHELRFALKIRYWDEDELPLSGLSDLSDSLNCLCFPSLEKLDLACDLSYDGELDDLPCFDLEEFVDNQSQLLHLALDVPDLALCDLVGTTRLRSFRGHASDAVHLLAQNDLRLEELHLMYIHRSFSEPPSLHVPQFPSLSTLTKLSVSLVDACGNAMKFMDELKSQSLQSLVTSFPNLTHLDVPINKLMWTYPDVFSRLTRLESLRLSEHHIQDVPIGATLSELFPHKPYITEIHRLLPSLAHLKDVAVSLLVDDGDKNELWMPCGCRTNVYVNLMLDMPETRVDYEFVVLRAAARPEVVLAHSEFMDKRTKRRVRHPPVHADL
uniref:F-box domain-containing protein n=1 Tax=Mycena chlorophos TaxID=658473 RepID=A0ABQ0LYI9_MYCCL|nr:predicted protein [Mycena chlorophos]